MWESSAKLLSLDLDGHACLLFSNSSWRKKGVWLDPWTHGQWTKTLENNRHCAYHDVIIWPYNPQNMQLQPIPCSRQQSWRSSKRTLTLSCSPAHLDCLCLTQIWQINTDRPRSAPSQCAIWSTRTTRTRKQEHYSWRAPPSSKFNAQICSVANG